MNPQSISWLCLLYSFKLLFLIRAQPGGQRSSNLVELYQNCGNTFSCGNQIAGISYPFRRSNDPSYCGHPSFVLTCDGNNSVTNINIMNTTYRVLKIDQNNEIMTIARADIMGETCPGELVNTTLDSMIFDYDSSCRNFTFLYGCPASNLSGFNYIPCGGNVGAYVASGTFGPGTCNTSVIVQGTGYEGQGHGVSSLEVKEALQKGCGIKWKIDRKSCSDCVASKGRCGTNLGTNQTICYCPQPPYISDICTLPGNGSSSPAGAIIAVVIITIFIIAIVFYIKRRCCNRQSAKNKDIEHILLQYGSLAPKRYKYSKIKKITKSFRDKLGKGGYGTVYKGKLPDGSLVAVKVLMETDSNGEEFINEVASISRTSHVNIVTLLGFCYEGSKRALIYEFMPNKSLDIFLRNNETAADADCSLNFKKLYRIAVGIAKGLEYLHSGCNTRIVHFDIKPQNILLDEDLCPKISDFGLAKLCKKKQSILSVIGARGTIGYIAPEMFSRNFGGVSHKSDVYSFGMMVLEMAGAKKIVEADTVGSSENYFPDNIYKHVVIGGTHKVVDEFVGEEIGRKMFLVGFWCIQTSPSDRPSMSKVVEMLEGSVESIQIPPKPTLFSPALTSLPLSVYVESQTTNSDEEA